MIERVLLDTGPIIALIDQRDQHHAWTKAQFSQISAPLLTCEAVLTEACFLASRTTDGMDAVLALVEKGVMCVAFNLADHFSEVSRLMRRYAKLPMSLADACLVRMSETVRHCTVFTLDSDFTIYRRNGRQTIPVLLPD